MSNAHDILSLVSEEPPGAPFEPLDESVALDHRRLADLQQKYLLDRCKGKVDSLPPALYSAFPEWKQSLSLDQVGIYCGLVGTLFKSALLKCGLPRNESVGHVRDTSKEPRFEIYAYPNSPLARDARKPGNLVYSTAHMTQYLSARTGQPHDWSELAWRSLTKCLEEIDESPLPGLSTRWLAGQVDIQLTQ